MATIHFTSALRRFHPAPPAEVAGATIGAALAHAFENAPILRGYVLDDQGAVRVHVKIFLNDWPIRDSKTLSDPIAPTDSIYVIQALSGG